MADEERVKAEWAAGKAPVAVVRVETRAHTISSVTRHSCATRLLDANVPLPVIKEFMGHKCIQTTMRYAHVRPQTLEEAILKRKERRREIHLRSRSASPTSHEVGEKALQPA